MLTIHRLTTDRRAYYLSDLARELPALTADRGEWAGTTAGLLGLDGRADPDALEALLRGLHPATGARLRSERAGVLAYDLTFSAPKAASVLYALAGEEVASQVVSAHRSAVRGAVSYLDHHVMTADRRLGHERMVVATDGLVGAAFTHGLSRTGDPHLHTHLVTTNLVHGDDGRWSACDQRALWAHRRAASELYHAHLRGELTERLGVEWRMAPGAAAELVGIEPALLGEFSSRSAQIRQHGRSAGARSAHGNRIAWAVTRPPKEPGTPFAELVPAWQRRADACAAPLDLAAVLDRGQPPQAVVAEHAFAAELFARAEGGVRRRDVVAAFAQGAPNGAPSGAIEQLADVWVPPSARGVGVAEPPLARHRVIPGGYHMRALGPRPLEPAAQACWHDAATQIDQYRARWHVAGSAHALGSAQPEGSWPTARLVDHLRTSAALHEARARLGSPQPPTVDLGRGR